MRSVAYCSILARNYLPKALALAESLRRHDEGRLTVLLIDCPADADLPEVEGVDLLSTASLGLDHRAVLHLATIYDLVEFATSVKPLLLRELLAGHEQVAYLDPDTFVTSPMTELPETLTATEGGILLTPHFLDPPGPDAPASEGHLLTVGFFNLGFCAVDRRATRFLDWWWGHLENECLFDPLSGLFVDQKWMDVGAPLFQAGSLRHSGYNVSVVNLHERPLDLDEDGLHIPSRGERLRLFHFHSFDTRQPHELSTRFDGSTAHLRQQSRAVDALCSDYAEILRRHEQDHPDAPPYPYRTDTRGRRISRHTRRAYRLEALESGQRLPSPFVPDEADAYDAWRRGARAATARQLVGDAAKSLRFALPDEVARVKRRFPGAADRVRTKYVTDSGVWG